jgi:eukaryotic-like serine/threonine-protein kinase
MTPGQLQRVEEIFYAALKQEPDQVARFLKTACGGDELLRDKVEALLASREQAAAFMETSAVGLATKIIQTEQAHPLVGQTIGHYKISEPIGTGGMGEVYLATDVIAGRKAALKLLPMRFTGDAARLTRFQQEAHAVVGLNHPNILTVYEIGQDHSTHYIASELIEGETLRQRLARGRMQLSEAVDIAIQVASALAAAHQAGIVHRDIKPENIMLRPDGYVKVLDFGIAKLAEQEVLVTTPRDEALFLVETNLGSILGTVRYMSPEQACGAHVDKTTDIWSLGAVLYEMVTGHTPFTGDTPGEVMTSILEKEPPPLTRYIKHTPTELHQIIDKTLRKDRGQRYPSAHELLQTLKDLRRKLEAQLERAAAPLWLRWARSTAALVLVLTIAALVLALPFYWHRNLATSSAPEKSIAVLPLQNLSEDKENAFFADGVQDELLSNLSKIKDLKVISRTSVVQYKSDAKRNLKQIAQQLGVSNVVEGSVRRSGDHVRVSVQLIDAQTDRHLWGENYDRTLADSLSLQGELATEIAGAVGATLSPEEKARVEANLTNNPAAYDAYLRARAIPVDWGFALESDIASAIHLYEQAVKLDPNFTLAWAYLSIAQIQSAGKGIDSGPAQRARAKDSLNHALALDPNLPEVHLARGYNEEDDTRALAEFRRAEQGLPNSVDVIEAIARLQRALGHWDEAVADLRRGIELDPRNISASNNLALTYCAMRRFSEALATLDRVLAWDPTNARALLTKADALMAIGDLQAAEPLLANPEVPAGRRAMYELFQRNYAAATEILSKDLAVDRRQRDPGDILSLAFSQQLAGDIAAARAIYQERIEDFRQLEKVAPGSYGDADTSIGLGRAYAGLGEAASAIAEGQKAMALVPSSKNPEFGPDLEAEMARIYAQLGDADHAIPMLKRLLRTQYASATFLTPATLRLDPIWDLIRNDSRFQELTAENSPLPEKSIAVLPFENLSKGEENAFFAGGVQDEILMDLAKVADLKVISRTSVMKYKPGTERNLREIAKDLGISHVVEGTVQRAGGRVRVSAQLIDARNDTHLWAEHYDRDVADVFAIQSDIARQIADQLKAKLSPAEKAAIAERPTADLVAYAYYTKAKEIDIYENWEGAENSANQKVQLLEKAIQRDPNFALAYCALAKTQEDISGGVIDDPRRDELAKKAAEIAVRLRPDLGEAHLELARYYFYTFDYDRARDELSIVRRKLPNNAEALLIEAKIDRAQNRWDDALANFQKANGLDPRNVQIGYHLAVTYFWMRRYSEYEQLLTKDAASGNPWSQCLLAEAKLAQGDPVAAQDILKQVPLDFSPTAEIWDTRFNAALYQRDYDAANRVIVATPAKWAELAFDGLVARARGDKQKAQAVFAAAREKMEAQQGDKPKDAPYFASVAKLDAGLGRKDEAISEARRAVEIQPIAKDADLGPFWVANLALVYAWTGERGRALAQLEIVAKIPAGPTYGDLRFNPRWDDLRGDSRFDKIVAEAKAASR